MGSTPIESRGKKQEWTERNLLQSQPNSNIWKTLQETLELEWRYRRETNFISKGLYIPSYISLQLRSTQENDMNQSASLQLRQALKGLTAKDCLPIAPHQLKVKYPIKGDLGNISQHLTHWVHLHKTENISKVLSQLPFF